MSELNKNRFKGYCNTPLLWASNSILNLNQFDEAILTETFNADANLTDQIRLGKLIEQFVFFQLEQNKSVQVIVKNLQVIDQKITIGEIDCILKYLEEYIHIEVVYKFYLYDEHLGPTEIDKWIGPNRKDSLALKLKKLKQQQLPIIQHSKTKEILSMMSLDVDSIRSMVYFKAQLFIPEHLRNHAFKTINNACIMGSYIGISEYQSLNTQCFYMPSKLDWLIDPHIDVKWLEHKDFTVVLEAEIKDSRSPLCWMKDKEGAIRKIFVVYWKG